MLGVTQIDLCETQSDRLTPTGSGVYLRSCVAPVAELVDALDSKSSSARSAGSIPARGTIFAILRRDCVEGLEQQGSVQGL